MKFCPTCQQCYEDDRALCADDQTALQSSRPGTRLIAHKYSLDRVLSRDEMETIYAGIHLETDRPVAIKLLRPRSVADDEALKHFRREAHAVAHLNTRIDHQRVAKTYDYGLLPDGAVYITMELVAGQPLREYIDKVNLISVATAVRIARQVADGLDAAHRCGVVHGTLEPANIILTRDYYGRLEAKVLDFGFAKLRKQISAVNGDGTPVASAVNHHAATPYTAPEQRRAGHNPDERADIYSLGAILYEMLAGRPPSEAAATAATTSAGRFEEVEETPPVKEARSDTPEPLAQLVQQALRDKPSARLRTAAEVGRQLRLIEASLAHNPQIAAPPDAPTSNHVPGHALINARTAAAAQKPPSSSPALLESAAHVSRDESKPAGMSMSGAEDARALVDPPKRAAAYQVPPAPPAVASASPAAPGAAVVTQAAAVNRPSAPAPTLVPRPALPSAAANGQRLPAKFIAANIAADAAPAHHPQTLPFYAILIALIVGISGGVLINIWTDDSAAAVSSAASISSPSMDVHAAGQQQPLTMPTTGDGQRADVDDPSVTSAGVSSSTNIDKVSPAQSQGTPPVKTESDGNLARQGSDDAAPAQSVFEQKPSATLTSKPRESSGGATDTTAPAVRKPGDVGRCTLSISASSLTIRHYGGSDTITVSLGELAGPSARVTASTPNWPDIVVFPEPQTPTGSGPVKYSIRSVSQRAGTYSVNFRSACGSKTVPVTVNQP